MKILQHNIQSFRTNKNLIEMFINTNLIDVCLFSEVFSFNEDDFRLKLLNFNMVSKFRSDGYGGVAIAVRNNIKFKVTNFQSTADIKVITTTNLQPNFVFVSVYFAPSLSTQIFKDEINNLFTFCERQNNVIIGGVFNARAEIFGDVLTSAKGKVLVDALNASSFYCLNNKSFTFYQNQGVAQNQNGSVLDLSFVNAVNSNFSWNTLNVYLGKSHHKLILIENINVQTTVYSNPAIDNMLI